MAWSANFDDFVVPPVCEDVLPEVQNRKQYNQTQTNQSSSVKIAELSPGITVSHIVGVVIAKDDPRHFPSKKDPTNERHVLSFTLRDSPEDFINVSCWGGEQFITDLASLFHIGIAVELFNVMVQAKPVDGSDERFRPNTPSMYQMSLNEARGSVQLYSGWNITDYTSLMHIPVKVHNDYYTISDIQANAASLQGQCISIMVVVKQVSPVKDIMTKMGRQVKRCEVHLFDETAMDFTLVLWDVENITQAQEWIPKQTVLFIADVRVNHNEYRKSMVATASSKTVITANPDTQDARQLFQYADTCDLPAEPVSKYEGGNIIDLESIQAVYNISELCSLCEKSSAGEPQYCIVYAVVSNMNMDAEDPASVLITRCLKCRQRTTNERGRCVNQDCPQGCMTDLHGLPQETETHINLSLALSDHTGTINGCILTGESASNMLNLNASQFLQLNSCEKTSLKWKFLLERCKVYVKVHSFAGDNTRGRVKIINCFPAKPQEVRHHIH